MELFQFFTRWNFEAGLMPPKFTSTRQSIGLCSRMITIVTAQELRLNGVEHVARDLEKERPANGSELNREERSLQSWIDQCIDEIERLFVKRDLGAVMESVSPTGQVIDHFDGRLLNPGHAIEGAWFIMLEGKIRGDDRLIRLGCDMLDFMWHRGWDREYGGLYYFRDAYDKPVQEHWHDMKFWWPHNETIIATLMAFVLTGEEKYAQWHQMVYDWSFQHFADPIHGEWFGYLHRDGSVASTTKGNLWKSCFHLPRMQFVCWQLLNDSQLNGVSEITKQ
jgi:N-acylglucosamine 2-epimerase